MPREPLTQQPDIKPGNYYVSVRRDDGDFRLLVGPFPNDHASALAVVDRATKVATDLDPRAWWYSYGTALMAPEHDEPGILQKAGKW